MNETMEERFLETWDKAKDEDGYVSCYEVFKFMEKEISLAISSHDKELVEKVEGLKKEGYAQYMASEKKHLERINFNEALDQVINLITDSK